MEWDAEADVVVVGAGGCGSMAAVTAATYGGGVDVILLEKDSRVTPASSIAGGMLQAAGTRYQRAAGVDDSPESMAEDIFKKNHYRSDPEVTLAVCRKAASVVEWFADYLGLPMEFAPEVEWLGHSRPRMHAHPKRSGAPLLQALRDRISLLPNITFVDQSPGQGLIAGDDGAVIGVLTGVEGDIQRIGARRVVLAAGGFSGNHEMIVQYIPEMKDAPHIGAQTHTGEAIRWGIEAGAAAVQMGNYQGLGYLVPGFGTRLSPGVIYGGGIMVDTSGRRFEREDQGYSEWAGVLLRQPGGVAIAIWNERINEPIAFMAHMLESSKAGAIVRCETLSELAQRFGLDEQVLAQTTADYNAGAASGHDALGREALPDEPLGPPYYASRVTGAVAHTQGGLKIDVHGRVLRPYGGVVPNLYAGGNVAVGISGDTPDGYTSGNGLLMAYTMGKIIGEDVVTSLRK